MTVEDIAFDTELTFEARVDEGSDGGEVVECEEDDNRATAMDSCPSIR